MHVLKMIARILDRKETNQAAALFVLIVGMSIFEVVGVAAVLPFLNVMINPGLIESNAWLNRVYEFGQFDSTESFVIFLGLALFGLILLSMLVRAVATYFITRFSVVRAYSLSTRLLETYLATPYKDIVSRNSSEVSRRILSEVDTIISGLILPFLLLVSNLLVSVLIGLMVIAVNPTLALATIAALGIPYMATFMFLQGRIRAAGNDRNIANEGRFHVLDEIITVYKDLKVNGQEQRYVNLFRAHAWKFAISLTRGLVLGKLPRFALEGMLYGGFIFYALAVFILYDGDLTSAVPTIGLIGMAATKLFPSLQQIFAQASLVRMNEHLLQSLLSDSLLFGDRAIGRPEETRPARIGEGLALRDIWFTYPGNAMPTLRGLDMDIPFPSKIGIVGGTGSGKTTLLDILIGLLPTDRGSFLADGRPLSQRDIQKLMPRIGYVGQNVSLIDASVAENVALGADPGAIDMDAVRRAVRAAHLDRYVEDELDDGYATLIGRNGVKLSGGQRQRLGIARALYKDPDILILDEATSALDNLVEAAFIDGLESIAKDRIIIMVAHRLSTVRDCDRIYFLQSGQVLASGSYDQLLDDCAEFRALVEARPA